MKLKRELNTVGVERIKGLTSQALADRCPDARQVYPVSPCTNCGCEYAINEPGYMNCSFVAAEVSDHTLEEIGAMMGISREGIRKIELRALMKVRMAMGEPNQNEQTAIREQGLAAGPDHINADREGAEPPDQPDSVPAIDRRELA